MPDMDTNIDVPDTVPTKAPKKTVKKAKKKRAFPRARIEAAAPKVPSQFTGISANECCDAQSWPAR